MNFANRDHLTKKNLQTSEWSSREGPQAKQGDLILIAFSDFLRISPQHLQVYLNVSVRIQ